LPGFSRGARQCYHAVMSMATGEKMRAVIFEGPNRLRLRQIRRPEVRDGEVLIRVHAAAICGTDLRILSGRKTRDVRVGHPIGHECAGAVAAVGAGVTDFVPGDRVAVCVVVSCGSCEYCDADKENLCRSRITLGYHTDGAFAEFMLIPAHAVRRGNLFKLPGEVPTEMGPLLEPMACCINGQHEMGLGSGGPESLLIFGAGPIGLLHLMLATARGGEAARERGSEGARAKGGEGADGASRLGGAARRSAGVSSPVGWTAVVEPNPKRRALAADFGAQVTCSPDEFEADEQFDAVILAVGVPELVNVALKAVRPNGRISLFAGFDKAASVAIDPNAIHYKQIRVTGASESRRRDYAEALSLVRQGRVDPAPLITHRFRLEDYQEAFRTAADGSALKVVLEM